MWYCSPSEDQREPVLPDEIVEPDLKTASLVSAGQPLPDGVPSGPGSVRGRMPSRGAVGQSVMDAASTGPGSEYWLP